MKIRNWIAPVLCGALLTVAGVQAQQAPSAPVPTPPSAAGAPSSNADFLKTADEVLAEMSQLLSLPVLQPLKKRVRSREEIRDYLIHAMKEDKDDAKRDADRKTMEALGLIPRGYPLEQKMLALLTEQIAGLYDAEDREFFIADWTSPADQRMIMAHELTHALQDQHFHVEDWEKAAKPNDDGELARDSVLEGSAMVAMLDYVLRGTGKSTRDIPGFDPSQMLGDSDNSPEFSAAPEVIRDEMLFPYVSGSSFIVRLLKTWPGGWGDLHKIFENPPMSSQQILHPDLYLRGVAPVSVTLPSLSKILPKEWKELDENVLGEFGVNEVLKQFLGKARADDLSPSWAGDRYALFERRPDGRTLLVMRLQFQNDADAARYFGAYSAVLEMKDKDRSKLVRRPNYFSFETPDGGVFLRCFANQCLSAEGTTSDVFVSMTGAIGWPAGPVAAPGAKQAGILAGLPAATLQHQAFLDRPSR